MCKTAMFTDIHFGRRSNSEEHNQDCLNFIDWACNEIKRDSEISAVVFLGDWNENRSSINLATLNYSYSGAKLLNDLGLPVYHIVGNHDLYHRHSRDIHSIIPFQEFSNFIMVDKITYCPEMNSLFCPFLFEHEYTELVKYTNVPVWFGHFEFKGFAITGYGTPHQHGPDHTLFNGPKKIFSGHFHKRQTQNNVHYIGNTFPMDFGDAGDNAKGLAIYNHNNDSIEYKAWPDAPSYIKVNLSELIDGNVKADKKTRIDVLVDMDIDYSESAKIKDTFMKKINPRELILTESKDIINAITEDVDIDLNIDDNTSYSIDELIVLMLKNIDVNKIDNSLLVKIYEDL